MSRCDSCGMPLNDSTHGTEADGSISTTYCLTCYAGGVFTAPDATVEQARDAADELIAKFPDAAQAHLARWLGGRAEFIRA